MEYSQVKENIRRIKNEINEVLRSTSEDREIELINIIKRQETEKLLSRDRQLYFYGHACKIFIVESSYKTATTIFKLVDSLDVLEELFLNLLYYCRRFEYEVMPEEELYDAILFIIKYHISGVALFHIIEIGTTEKENNLIQMARWLKRERQLITAVLLLQLAVNKYKENADILVELADCWLETQQWKRALETLKRIKKPSEEIEEIVMNLEEVLGNESIE